MSIAVRLYRVTSWPHEFSVHTHSLGHIGFIQTKDYVTWQIRRDDTEEWRGEFEDSNAAAQALARQVMKVY